MRNKNLRTVIHLPLIVKSIRIELKFCMQISSVANMMVRMMNDFEVNAVSIERAKEYTAIPQEVLMIN